MEVKWKSKNYKEKALKIIELET